MYGDKLNMVRTNGQKTEDGERMRDASKITQVIDSYKIVLRS